MRRFRHPATVDARHADRRSELRRIVEVPLGRITRLGDSGQQFRCVDGIWIKVDSCAFGGEIHPGRADAWHRREGSLNPGDTTRAMHATNRKLPFLGGCGKADLSGKRKRNEPAGRRLVTVRDCETSGLDRLLEG